MSSVSLQIWPRTGNFSLLFTEGLKRGNSLITIVPLSAQLTDALVKLDRFRALNTPVIKRIHVPRSIFNDK